MNFPVTIETMDRLSNWFEQKYLRWQMDNGRASLEDFAKYLDISQPYLSLILNGNKKNLGKATANNIARKLNDFTLLDILGYARPAESELFNLLPGLKERIDLAVSEVLSVYESIGITDTNSPEARKIAIRILAEHGFEEKESDNS